MKIKSKLEGYRNDISNAKTLIFENIELDILRLLEPVSNTLQEACLPEVKPFPSVKKQSKVLKSFFLS